MLNEAQGPWKVILSVLFFPLFFQDTAIRFAWGAEDEFFLQLFKRIFILLPVCSIVASCWLTIICILTILIRIRRREFMSALFLTWWDMGRSILTFWGGVLRFMFYISGWMIGLLRFVLMGFWAAIADFVFAPFRIAKQMGGSYMRPGVPWIAVVITFIWCILEAGIFAFVMQDWVTETFTNLTQQTLPQIPTMIVLYLMLFTFVLGSYAVLSTWVDAIKEKQIGAMIKIGIFEVFVMLIEVVFLYREFVDGLVPWIAQYAGTDFRLGIIGVLGIAGFAWMGVRGMSWFLFASAGTPTILAIIQRKGVQPDAQAKAIEKYHSNALTGVIWQQIKKDTDWIYQRGDEVLGSFLLPPLQILAAMMNFVMLLVVGRHVFSLPFHSIKEVADTKTLLANVQKSVKEES